MSNTAMELWFDDQFLVDRIKQQETYLLDLEIRRLDGLDWRRYMELRETAEGIKKRLEHQLNRPHFWKSTWDDNGEWVNTITTKI